jgi:hypothetical protein
MDCSGDTEKEYEEARKILDDARDPVKWEIVSNAWIENSKKYVKRVMRMADDS